MKKFFVRILLLIVVLLAALAVYGYLSWSAGAPVYPETARIRSIELPLRFRSWDEHDAIVAATHPKPYILEIQSGTGSLIFYGAHHTSSPQDPQHADIEKRWAAFRPTVALYEGRRRGYFRGPLFEKLEGKSESATVHELARSQGVPVYTLEPDYADEVAALLKQWSPEQVALFFTTRVYWSEAGGKANEKLAEHLRAKRTDVIGLRESLTSVAHIDRVWRRDFPLQPDWRILKGEPEGTYLTEIADDSRRIRGEHMARSLIDLVRKGERVFAVVGSGHVIRLEWILRSALQAPPAPDQPVS